MPKQSKLREAAKRYYDAGLNVLPAKRAEKRPVGAWKKWTKERPAFETVFPAGLVFDAVCVVCGATSGGLEIIDFDQKAALYPAFCQELKKADVDVDFPIETTQRGGKHLAFRSKACGKNQKLANNESGCAIETRGEGGICIIAPTDGYAVESAVDWTAVPEIDPGLRDLILDCARVLDADRRLTTSRKTEKSTPKHLSQTYSEPFKSESASDYLRRELSPLRESLRRAGWTYLRTDGDFEQWERPDQPVSGKPGGSVNVKERYFYCFTSNAPPFEPNTCYSPLDVIALLDFGGDVSAASKAFCSGSSVRRRRTVIDVTHSEEIDAGPQPGGRFELPLGSERSAPPLGTLEQPELRSSGTSAPASSPTGSDYRKPERQLEPGTAPSPSRKAPPAEEFPASLLNCGGLIGEFADVANRFAIRPQPEGAFLAGLSCVSYLAGRSFALNYAGTLVTPNLYALFLAPSGMGKEVLRRVCSSVAYAYRPNESVPESFASVQALQNMTARVKKLFWLHDEFGRDLAVMAGRQTNVNISGVVTESLKLYSNANNRNYLPKLVASEAKGTKRPDPVDRPSLTIFATGNPTEFYEATTEAVLRNGYVSRFTIVYGRTYSEKRKTTFDDAVSAAPMALADDLTSRVKQWRNFEETYAKDPSILTFDRSAFDCLAAYDEQTEKEIRLDVFNSDGVTEMKARLFEKAWKYALLFALSEFGARPGLTVGRRHAELAVALVDYEARQFAKNAQKFAASDVSALAGEILEFVRASGGAASLSQITRKFQRHDKRRRDEALATLVDADYVEVFDYNGKKIFSLTNNE